MIAGEAIFPKVPTSLPVLVDGGIQVIETLGVEVLLDSPAGTASDSKLPANHNDVIPFASTLRRVG